MMIPRFPPEVLDAIPPESVDVMGVMHSSANITGRGIETIQNVWSGPLSAYPDSGFSKCPIGNLKTSLLPRNCWISQRMVRNGNANSRRMLRARTGTHRGTLGTEILRFFLQNFFQVHKPMNMVKLLLLLCLISGMSFFSEQSLADQNDPRLATLFLKLGNAETPQESKPFERQIWQVWMEHESPEISTKLQEGTWPCRLKTSGKLWYCSAN